MAILSECTVVEDPVVQEVIKGGHWALADAHGNSAVVAYLDGKLHHWDNEVGVLTNDPPFDWHLTNLNSYVNLQASWPHSKATVHTSSGPIPRTVGHGWNLAGIPGDYSPPSRFVRLFYLRQFALLEKELSVEEAIAVGTGLVNNVHIIKGTVAGEHPTSAPEYTTFSVIKVPSSKSFLFRGYTDMQWKQINVGLIRFGDGAELVSHTVPQTDLNVKDVTSQLQPTASVA